MLFIIAIAFIAILALIIFGTVLHFVFSPWILLAIGILVLIKLRPRRPRR
jgi:hypothetical protein